jgi:hypothetical protein
LNQADWLESALKSWGRVYGQRAPSEDELTGNPFAFLGTGKHPIATAMEFAGGEDAPVGRSARAMVKIRHVPSWGFEPMVCTETRSHRIATSDDIPLAAQRVQRAVLALYAVDPALANVLRIRYCERGRTRDKASELGVRFSRFMALLAAAKQWIGWKLAERRAA